MKEGLLDSERSVRLSDRPPSIFLKPGDGSDGDNGLGDDNRLIVDLVGKATIIVLDRQRVLPLCELPEFFTFADDSIAINSKSNSFN